VISPPTKVTHVDSSEFQRTWGGFSAGSRILVVGTSGAGKSTLARRLARVYGLRDIELDSLHWEANWKGASPEVFRQRLLAALRVPGGFVVHGNYGKVRDLTWGSSDTVVWLNYPRWLVMARVFRRTVLRVVRREVLWQGNRETFQKSFLSRDSILVWAWTTFRRRGREYRALARSCPFPVREILVVNRPHNLRQLFPGNGRR